MVVALSRFVVLFALGASIRLEVMVTSKWSNFERRQIQRYAIHSCTERTADDVELLFFMGDANMTDAMRQEREEFRDLVVIGGPDSDPEVARDETYVLDYPAARTYRVLHGTAWLARNRPHLDYVMYLDDDSFLDVPRLLDQLRNRGTARLAMGYVMETDLDWSGTNICEVCTPCSKCLGDSELLGFCEQFPQMSLGGCAFAVQNCNILGKANESLGDCVASRWDSMLRLTSYFQSRSVPRWMLGMGWVFGRTVVHFLERNAETFKVRGAADVSLGFWLAPLEDVDFVDMRGLFMDHPEERSTFAHMYTSETLLVHRMNPKRWMAFRAGLCKLSLYV